MRSLELSSELFTQRSLLLEKQLQIYKLQEELYERDGIFGRIQKTEPNKRSLTPPPSSTSRASQALEEDLRQHTEQS
jgi:hypothetical protein